MQQQIEKYLGESRFAIARNLVVTLPQKTHAAWFAAIDILQYTKDDPKKALALDVEDSALSEAAVRKAFKLRSVLVHPDKFSSRIAESAFRNLSQAHEQLLHLIRSGGTTSAALASAATPDQFPWWEPWDQNHGTPRPFRDVQSCACAAGHAASNSARGHDGTGASLEHNDQTLHRADDLHGKAQQQPSGSSKGLRSGPNKRRKVEDRDVAVDVTADTEWLRGLSAAALADEVQWRQSCLMNALANRPRVAPQSELSAQSQASRDGASGTEADHTQTGDHHAHRSSIGGVSVERLGRGHLRAAVDRARSQLAISRTGKPQDFGAGSGGFL